MAVVKREPDWLIEDLRCFCAEAASQMLDLQARLRELVTASDRQPEHVLLEDAMDLWLRVGQSLLDAGRLGHHGRILALRPLLRALTRSHY